MEVGRIQKTGAPIPSRRPQPPTPNPVSQNPPPPPPPPPPPDDPPLNPEPLDVRGDELMALPARCDMSESLLEKLLALNAWMLEPAYQVGGSR